MFSFDRNIVIFHADGTSGYVPTCCSSWIAHWRNNTNLQENKCSILGCNRVAEVGSHIKLKGVRGFYIVPCCYSCNNKGGKMLLKKRVLIVSVKKKFCKANKHHKDFKAFPKSSITLKASPAFKHFDRGTQDSVKPEARANLAFKRFDRGMQDSVKPEAGAIPAFKRFDCRTQDSVKPEARAIPAFKRFDRGTQDSVKPEARAIPAFKRFDRRTQDSVKPEARANPAFKRFDRGTQDSVKPKAKFNVLSIYPWKPTPSPSVSLLFSEAEPQMIQDDIEFYKFMKIIGIS